MQGSLIKKKIKILNYIRILNSSNLIKLLKKPFDKQI